MWTKQSCFFWYFIKKYLRWKASNTSKKKVYFIKKNYDLECGAVKCHLCVKGALHPDYQILKMLTTDGWKKKLRCGSDCTNFNKIQYIDWILSANFIWCLHSKMITMRWWVWVAVCYLFEDGFPGNNLVSHRWYIKPLVQCSRKYLLVNITCQSTYSATIICYIKTLQHSETIFNKKMPIECDETFSYILLYFDIYMEFRYKRSYLILK